jgi:hypothetical protein
MTHIMAHTFYSPMLRAFGRGAQGSDPGDGRSRVSAAVIGLGLWVLAGRLGAGAVRQVRDHQRTRPQHLHA